jgi:hypothetical protein
MLLEEEGPVCSLHYTNDFFQEIFSLHGLQGRNQTGNTYDYLYSIRF